MAKTLRVHMLAKELGVPSKEIIAKCKAEGIELKNHMSTISIGLAESIREWFSAGEDVTSIETAERVDLEKVRKRRARKKKAASEQAAAADETAVATAEPPAADRPAATAVGESEAPDATTLEAPPAEVPSSQTPAQPAPAVASRAADQVEPTPTTGEAAGTRIVPSSAEPTPTEPVAPAAAQPDAEAPPASEEPSEPPKPPEVIKPAGPQVVPKPAELRGPRVVRVEAPDTVPAPRPRPRSTIGPRRVGMPPEPTVPARGRGRGKGREKETVPHRGRSPRRHGRGSDVMERIREWHEQDVLERKERLASATGHGLRARKRVGERPAGGGPPTVQRKREIELEMPASVKEFCTASGVPYAVVSRKLIEHTGKLYRINDMLNAETAELLALDLGLTIKVKAEKTPLDELQEKFAALERKHLQPRPPVVTMLGHVDHGKTSLLDAIRKTNVAAKEAGGITQHIGAYRVNWQGWDVTFLDTPGHEAFTAMRARGAHLTDVVVLVVAADDGVMPQTVEAINHAKAAGVPIVVALNKIDLPGVDINRIYGQLAEHGLTPSEWGGETDVIKTSAATGEGISELLEHLSTLSELLDLKADPTIPAHATVVEAKVAEGRGPVATVLVREGTLRPGATVVCGPAYGRVRSLIDSYGQRVKQATPGTPVEVLGLDTVPDTGDELYQVNSTQQAKKIAEFVREQRRQKQLAATAKPQTLEELLRSSDESEVPELAVIVKADNVGTLEAVTAKLNEFPDDKARLRVLHSGVGAVTEADVDLARASNAVIVGFYVTADEGARRRAEEAGVEIRTYRVIYELLEDMHKALEGLLEPERKVEQRGRAEVRQIFHVSRVGTVAGCLVVDGVIGRSHRVRLVRDGRVVLEEAGIASLKRFKDDVREVRAGMECGIKIEGYDDIKPGDVIEAFEYVEVAQKL